MDKSSAVFPGVAGAARRSGDHPPSHRGALRSAMMDDGTTMTVGVTGSPQGNPMEIPWKSYGNPTQILWKSYGSPEIPDKMTWKFYGNPEIR